MLLRNHGIVACGSTIEEAYHFAINITKACDIQVRLNLKFSYDKSMAFKEMKNTLHCYDIKGLIYQKLFIKKRQILNGGNCQHAPKLGTFLKAL